MTAPLLADALGPRGRRQVAIASVAAGGLVAILLVVAGRRFADKGQLDADLWRPFTHWGVIRFLLGGLTNTLRVAGVAMVMAIAIGGLLALGRLARSAPVRWLAGTYVEFFRAMPVVIVILFSYNGLPKMGIDLERPSYLILALVVYNSAVLGEIFRAGILSLDRGQSEAAFTIGLTYWQAMRLVILPQAVRRMIPALVSQLITLLKDTALGITIGYEELLRRGQINGQYFNDPLQSLIVVALMYIAVNFCLSRLAHRLEIRQRRRLSAGSISVAGLEDLATVQATAGAELS